MLVRLHDRTEGAAGPRGLSCDDEGLRFGGDFALIEAADGPLGRVFRYWGKTYNIDPRLLLALADAETHFGANVTMGAYNYWNWLWNTPKSNSSFVTPDQGIERVARGLNKDANLENLTFYDKTANGLGQDAWYYCRNNCMATSDLASILRRLGGNPDRLGYGATFRRYVPPSKEKRR